ncbi:MAG: PEP/pyruvate-binding domain-containing protein [Patescibacteria group bacterium]
MKEFILPFSKISKKDVGSCGGKGASLGEMTATGIPVPPGLVVTARAFERFLAETDIDVEIAAWLKKVNPKEMESVEEASEVLQQLIRGAKMSKDLEKEILEKFKKLKAPLVAVRSSATAEDSKIDSWAGELESYLNTTEKTLLQNVKNCWASLFSPRAIFYRLERGFGGKKVLVAVVVQKMVQSEVSGICFTVHPVTRDKNQMIIEAGWGLGEAIVGGIITPDSYVLNKKSWEIIDVNVSEQEKMIIRKGTGGTVEAEVPAVKKNKQKINGKQIIELAKLCAKIEKHYKFPCDIEWAMEKGKFYIVQSRPITTL